MAFVEREKSEKSKARHPKMPGTFLTWEFQDYFFLKVFDGVWRCWA